MFLRRIIRKYNSSRERAGQKLTEIQRKESFMTGEMESEVVQLDYFDFSYIQ
jgi:hypothetical protein